MQYLPEKPTMMSLPMANELLKELRDAATVLREFGHDRLADCLSRRAALLAEALVQAEKSEATPAAVATRSEFWLG